MGILIAHRLGKIANLWRDAQFLAQLAVERLPRCLAWSHLPAREFPLSAETLACRPLANQHAAVLFNDSRYHPYHSRHTTILAGERNRGHAMYSPVTKWPFVAGRSARRQAL